MRDAVVLKQPNDCAGASDGMAGAFGMVGAVVCSHIRSFEARLERVQGKRLPVVAAPGIDRSNLLPNLSQQNVFKRFSMAVCSQLPGSARRKDEKVLEGKGSEGEDGGERRAKRHSDVGLARLDGRGQKDRGQNDWGTFGYGEAVLFSRKNKQMGR